MTNEVKQEVEGLIEELELNCLVEDFKDIIDWLYLSHAHILSEEFIREFKGEVCWPWVSALHSQADHR